MESVLRPKGRKPAPKRRFIAKDIRLFINTIDHAVDAMKTAGIEARQRRRRQRNTLSAPCVFPNNTEYKFNPFPYSFPTGRARGESPAALPLCFM